MNALVRSIEERFFSDNPIWEPSRQELLDAVGVLTQAFRSDHLILTCGNGGGAADSAHMVGELVKSFRLPRPLSSEQIRLLQNQNDETGILLAEKLEIGLRAVALTDSAPALLAIANDIDPTLVFAQQVMALGRFGDVFVGFSTSGHSANVMHALCTSRALGLHTIGFTGAKPAKMDKICDLVFKADAVETYRIQELHLPLYHALCAMTEAALFG